MAWIESHQRLKSDPKLKRFCRVLGLSRPQAIGMLHELWWYALDHAESGDLSGLDRRDVAQEMDYPENQSDKLWNALTETGPNGESGFVEPSGQIHAWADYAGRLMRDRERKRAERAAQQPKAVRGPSKDCPGNSTLDRTVHNPTNQRTAPSLQQPEATEPPLLTVPCVGNGTKDWPLTTAKVREYEQAYPAVNVEAECRKAAQWCRDNPTKRKTAKGVPAFLNRWLCNAQDAPGARQRPLGNGRPADDTEAKLAATRALTASRGLS